MIQLNLSEVFTGPHESVRKDHRKDRQKHTGSLTDHNEWAHQTLVWSGWWALSQVSCWCSGSGWRWTLPKVNSVAAVWVTAASGTGPESELVTPPWSWVKEAWLKPPSLQLRQHLQPWTARLSPDCRACTACDHGVDQDLTFTMTTFPHCSLSYTGVMKCKWKWTMII